MRTQALEFGCPLDCDLAGANASASWLAEEGTASAHTFALLAQSHCVLVPRRQLLHLHAEDVAQLLLCAIKDSPEGATVLSEYPLPYTLPPDGSSRVIARQRIADQLVDQLRVGRVVPVRVFLPNGAVAIGFIICICIGRAIRVVGFVRALSWPLGRFLRFFLD